MSHDLSEMLESDRALNHALRGLPRRNPPAGMTTRLRVVASQERERVVHKRSWRSRVREMAERARLAFDNVMRPLAVPVAGGVFSAALLFNMWVVPAYPALAHTGDDVPTQLRTEARVKRLTNISVAPIDTIVDLTLDERGQLVEYRILASPVNATEMSRANLENLLVFSEFVPATSFGKPKKSKLRIGFSASRIDVKG